MTPFQKWLRRSTLGIALLLVLIVLPLYAFKISQITNYTDFEVYYRTAERVKNLQWGDVYNLKDGSSPFRYAPIFIPFFRPFAQLSLSQAQLVWFFLQYLWFGLGFYFIYRTLRSCQISTQRVDSLWMTSLGILFILRFCLDTFTIGQVSSLMFLGFSIGLYGWVNRKPFLAAAGILIPTLFKIGPGYLYGVFLSSRKKERNHAALTALTITFLVVIASFFWLGFGPITKSLWSSWSMIVANDSVYYDSSHYGNQSLNGFLLRGVRNGWWDLHRADQLYLGLALLICSGTALFWALRKPASNFGRGTFYSLGLFVYMWVMPETFKYSLTPLAIPIVFLFAAPRKGFFTWVALLFGIFCLSLAGKDIVGDPIFFGSQLHSLPLLATFLLGLSTYRLAWKNSTFSPLWNRRSLGPWEFLPETKRTLEASLLVPIPMNQSSSVDRALLRRVILDSSQLLETETQSRFEILLIPFGDRLSQAHPLFHEMNQLSVELKSVKTLFHKDSDGRGSALRIGFLASRGMRILGTQVEQPCDTDFFRRALKLLNSGVDLVRANRRLSQTQFKIPVKLLPLVYGRHRLGLLFNRLVRFILPIHTTDTHSGTFAASWRLALNAFAVQTSPNFLFEIELSLASVAHGYLEKDLPVSLSLAREKSVQRMSRETINILFGLPALAWRFRKGYYHSAPLPTGITADDWGLSPGVNQGILQLARLGVVKRISLMAGCPYLEEGLKELSSIPGIEIGLHFNLTYGKPLQKDPISSCALLQQSGPRKGYLISSPGKLMLQWINPFGNRSVNRTHVRAELRSQLDRLKKCGIRVQYLDGHHHIQIVPGLIDALADIIQDVGIKRVRLPYDRSLWFSSQAPIALFALLVRSRLKTFGFESLPCFYPQKAHFLDHGKLRARLAQKPNAEVIVHPAEIDDVKNLAIPDVYSSERVTEFKALRMLGIHL